MNGLTLPSYPEFVCFVPHSESLAVSSTAEFACRYTINNKGLRDHDYPYHKPKDKYRIVFIGDSFTEGHGVEQSQTYPSVVEMQKKNEWECINAGIRGSCPSDAYFRIRKLIALYDDIDLVVLQVYENDFEDDTIYAENLNLSVGEGENEISRLPFYQSHSYLKYLGPLAWPLSHLRIGWVIALAFVTGNTLEPNYIFLPKEMGQDVINIYKRHSIDLNYEEIDDSSCKITFPILSERILSQESLQDLWTLSKEKHHVTFGKPYLPTEIQMETTEKYLSCINHLCKQNDMNLFVFYIPSIFNLRNGTIDKELDRWCKVNDMMFWTARKRLKKEYLETSEVVYYPFNKHLTEHGNKVLGEALTIELEKYIASLENN